MSEQNSVAQTQQSNETEDAGRKLFVGGLSWQTTEDGLQRYFENLGMPVERVMIMRDKVTGRSRGFGFVILNNVDHLDKAVAATLQLDGRKVEAKRAIPKRDMEKSSRKLFVGGIPVSLTAADFKKYFEQFGQVTESQVVTERESGRSRGFGFVTFQEDEAVEKVLTTQHNIQGKPVEIKRAEPKKVERPKPIIVPVQVPYFTSGYPFGYPYMQGFTYDPSTGYVIQQPPGNMYNPQFFQMDSSNAVYSVDPQYLSPTYYETTPPSSGTSSPTVPSTSGSTRVSRRSGVGSSKRMFDLESQNEWTSNPMEGLSLVERVRVAQNEAKEMRKRRGTAPEPERPRRGSAFASTTATTVAPSMPTRRSVVAGAAWRSRGSTLINSNSASPSTSTTTSTTPKEGGALHKYFQ